MNDTCYRQKIRLVQLKEEVSGIYLDYVHPLYTYSSEHRIAYTHSHGAPGELSALLHKELIMEVDTTDKNNSHHVVTSKWTEILTSIFSVKPSGVQCCPKLKLVWNET